MFSASRIFSCSVLLLALAGLCAGCGKGGGDSTATPEAGDSKAGAAGKRIIILTNGTSPFWDAAKIGAQEAAADLKVSEAGLRVCLLYTSAAADE